MLVYDFFRDSLTAIPNDAQHLAKNVLSNSWHFTFGHWRGTIVNGVKRVAGRLLYGVPGVYERFFDSIESDKPPVGITAEDGLAVVKAQHAMIQTVSTPRR